MSLIDIRHFFSPFTNKVHFWTIVLLGMLFVVFRLQGGGVFFLNSNSEKRDAVSTDYVDTLSPQKAVSKLGVKRVEENLPPKATINLNEDRKALEDVLLKKEKKTASAKKEKADSLEDLAKELGLQ
ncbi:MAG: hypothetical protein D6780_05835 [Candidatus Dadabacteria bacterium]|nr:MAG: hypothetical protein D6780_05835 [Candidatus Dadabacteria bacterium]